jgi:hypothetical protein
VAERQDLDAGADLYAARARGNRAGDSERRGQHRSARLLMNFGQPDRIEATAVRCFDLCERLFERLCRGLLRPAVEFMVDADLHRHCSVAQMLPRRR